METEKLGIDYAAKLSYSIIAKSELPKEEKRKLLFSVYSLRCVFDNKEMTYVNPILKKYYCTFACKLNQHPDYDAHIDEFKQIEIDKPFNIPYGGIYVQDGDGYVVRFDAGSPVHEKFVAMGKLTGIAATVPEKYDLYELVLNMSGIKGASYEFKAMWYLMFSYILMMDAPHDSELYQDIKSLLISEKTFDALLDSKYSQNIPDTIQEMWAAQYPNVLVDFLIPFLEYKRENNENGVPRDIAAAQKHLARGEFLDAFTITEKMLNSFPDDDTLFLTNIAARVSLETKSVSDREVLLSETLTLLEEALTRPTQKKDYFLYYSGVCLIGLKRITEALVKFDEALEVNPNMETARLMKKAVEKELEK